MGRGEKIAAALQAQHDAASARGVPARGYAAVGLQLPISGSAMFIGSAWMGAVADVVGNRGGVISGLFNEP